MISQEPAGSSFVWKQKEACVCVSFCLCLSGMAGVLVDPREILKEVESLLGKDGELCSLEGVTKVFR